MTRALIERGLIPEDVTIQVLVQAREHLIRRTFEALEGAPRAIVHLYTNPSPVFRQLVYHTDLAGVADITIVNRAQDRHLGDALMEILRANTKTEVRYIDWDGPFTIPEGTDIVVNATSIGLYPNVDAMPNIDFDSIKPTMFVQDVIPNPTETAFIKEMRRRGIPCATGAGMLINQAALNIEMWTGLKPDKEIMYKALEEALA